MKNILSLMGSTMTAVGISLMAVSCGDKEDTANSGDAGDGNKKGKSGKPAPAEVDLGAQMIGYWIPDPEAMEKELNRKVAEDPSVAAGLPFMRAMMAKTAVHIPEKGQIKISGPGQAKNATYTIRSTDAATRTLTMDIVEDGEKGEGIAVVDGDTLVLTRDGISIHLNRIDETAFKQRLEEAKKEPAGIPGLPGGSPVPVPTPPVPGTP